MEHRKGRGPSSAKEEPPQRESRDRSRGRNSDCLSHHFKPLQCAPDSLIYRQMYGIRDTSDEAELRHAQRGSKSCPHALAARFFIGTGRRVPRYGQMDPDVRALLLPFPRKLGQVVVGVSVQLRGLATRRRLGTGVTYLQQCGHRGPAITSQSPCFRNLLNLPEPAMTGHGRPGPGGEARAN